LKTKIFCDIAELKVIQKFNKKKIVKGFTTNPSLMRKAGAKDYKKYSKKILKICNHKPVSLEVFADEYEEIKTQALKRSVMSQSQQILYDYSVQEIVEMGWVDYSDTGGVELIKQKCIKAAKDCFVDHLLKRNFNTLSGGEQRRVHFARTLLQIDHQYDSIGNRYMFLDEPTANLDLLFELQLIRLLKAKAEKGIGVLLIIHDLNLASKFSDKIAILKKGKLSAFGEPFEVFKSKTLSDIFGLAMDVDLKTLKVTYY